MPYVKLSFLFTSDTLQPDGCKLLMLLCLLCVKLKQLRHLCGINLTIFEADICQLISPTLCPTYEMLDDNLRLTLEKHAPLHSCRVSINQNDPWYNAIKSDIIAAKNIGFWQKYCA